MSKFRRAPAVALLFAFALSACQFETDPPPTLAPRQPVAPPAVAVTATPTDAPTPTEAPPTDRPPNPTPGAPIRPVWPIVDGESGWLLGGSHNGQWLTTHPHGRKGPPMIG